MAIGFQEFDVQQFRAEIAAAEVESEA